MDALTTKLQQQGGLYAYFNEHLELAESQHKMPVTWCLKESLW